MINGTRINELGKEQLRQFRRDNLGFVFQFYNLLPNLCVRDNIRIGEKLSKNPMDYGELVKLLESINKKYGTTIIMVTHNAAIPKMMDTTIVMRDGMIREIKKNPNPVPAEELNDL